MNKVILMIGGSREGKNAFQKTLKETLNYWVWNVSAQNECQFIVGLLGWNGQDKNETYQNFYTQLFDMAEKTFEFKKVYITRMVDRFLAHDRAQVLIIHNADEMIENFKDEDGLFSLYVAKNKGEMEANLNKYDKILLLDESFDNNVADTMKILIK